MSQVTPAHMAGPEDQQVVRSIYPQSSKSCETKFLAALDSVRAWRKGHPQGLAHRLRHDGAPHCDRFLSKALPLRALRCPQGLDSRSIS